MNKTGKWQVTVLANSQYHEFILGQIVRPYQGMLGLEALKLNPCTKAD